MGKLGSSGFSATPLPTPAHRPCIMPHSGRWAYRMFIFPSPSLRAALGKATAGIRALNLVGVNVTVPHKEKILRYLDELSPAASLYRAVNTVINRHGTLYGENTDGQGFLRSLAERKRSVRDREVVLIGAGGPPGPFGCTHSGRQRTDYHC